VRVNIEVSASDCSQTISFSSIGLVLALSPLDLSTYMPAASLSFCRPGAAICRGVGLTFYLYSLKVRSVRLIVSSVHDSARGKQQQ
jgi:hypothetical protein